VAERRKASTTWYTARSTMEAQFKARPGPMFASLPNVSSAEVRKPLLSPLHFIV
jgi:hypothetical protein